MNPTMYAFVIYPVYDFIPIFQIYSSFMRPYMFFTSFFSNTLRPCISSDVILNSSAS
jgi:hypothetical protein